MGDRRAWLRAMESVARLDRDAGLSLPGLVDEAAARHGDRPALVGAGGTLSYAALAERVHAVASWAERNCAGETVGLLARGDTGYAPIWLGLTRAGCTVALLNPSLTGPAMAHAVREAGCHRVVAATALASRVEERPVVPLEALADLTAPASPSAPVNGATALLIATSGTTGLPKAVRLTHRRIVEWALWFAGLMDLQPEDRIFDALPLHHSTGGVVAIGAALAAGASAHIAAGFSTRGFWDDVCASDSTVFFYIGEICRYLTQAPPHAQERAHRLRLACGNGLAAGVWERFQDRFAIPRILEFYAATEGSLSLYNVEGKPGAIGRIPPFLRDRFPLVLIRVDPETLEPERGPDGLCRRAAPGEPGEALGARRFDGYTNEAATSRKVLTDVLAHGDRWFRTGDLMRQDAAGYLYFLDRLGDTFRWKGENVSTTEVAARLRECPGVADAVAFGVAIPGHEGRAGMAAIVADNAFDPAVVYAHVTSVLPAYAQPIFLRLCAALETTGTFKLTAARLAAEGYRAAADPVLFLDRAIGRYVPCDAPVLARLEDGLRL